MGGDMHWDLSGFEYRIRSAPYDPKSFHYGFDVLSGALRVNTGRIVADRIRIDELGLFDAPVLTLSTGTSLASGWIDIGSVSAGNMVVEQGASVQTTEFVSLADSQSGWAGVVIRNPGSSWTSRGPVWTGDGRVSLEVVDGARLETPKLDATGTSASVEETRIVVSGTGSNLRADEIGVSDPASSILEVSLGASVHANVLRLAHADSDYRFNAPIGRVVIADPGSRLVVAHSIQVGRPLAPFDPPYPPDGRIEVRDGAHVRVNGDLQIWEGSSVLVEDGLLEIGGLDMRGGTLDVNGGDLVFRHQVPGDVNSDRLLDLVDSVLLRRHLAGLEPQPDLPLIHRVYLRDGRSDRRIAPLENGDVISLSDVGTCLGISVLVGETTESVRYDYTPPASAEQIAYYSEINEPFCFRGDRGWIFTDEVPDCECVGDELRVPGTHTLRVIPCSVDVDFPSGETCVGQGGVEGLTLAVWFRIVP